MSELNREPQMPSGPQDESEAALERSLRVAMGTCPPPAILFAFTENVLPDEATGPIRDHVTHCGVCQLVIADSAAIEEENALTPDQDARIVARIAGKPGRGNAFAKPPARWRMASLAIAAGLVVAVLGTGVWLRMRPSETASVVAPLQQPSPSAKGVPADVLTELASLEPLAPPAPGAFDLLTRGGEGGNAQEPTATELLPAFRAYNRKDYATAVAAFRVVAHRYPKASLPALYLGVSKLELNDNAAAASTLTPLAKLKNPSHDVLWYSAVAEARIGDPSAAALFARLCAAGNDAHTAESCRLAATIRR